jgi:ABC-type lipoprotein release transport system permease subunit
MKRTILHIAFRNFTRNSRRFLLLGLAVSAGFFFVFSVQSLISGLSNQINIRGARFYGGHIIIKPQPDGTGIATPEQERLVMQAVARAVPRPVAVSHRTHFGNYNGADGVLYFNGESVRIRRVIGMDWSAEGRKIGELKFISGNPSDMKTAGGIMISDVTARRLGAAVGDQVILQVYRQGGAINTISLWIRAIFREVSIFGYYTTYMDRNVLDDTLGFDSGYAATIGIYLRDYRQSGVIASSLQRRLGAAYAVTPVMDLMPEIRSTLDALTLVSYGILALLSVVIAVGILNMYRVIIYERTREIGTMRALGVQRQQVRNIILAEALFLALCGIVGGFVVSLVTLVGISQIPVSGNAGFDIFLDRGHLSWVLHPDIVGLDAVLITLVTLLGAISPARAAQAIDPVVAIRAE